MNRDRVYLQHIQQNIAHIRRLASDDKVAFLIDGDKQAAIMYYLHTLSESTTRLSDSLRQTQPQVAWQQIRGFRNRIVHEYLSVDLELVWLIVQNELVVLEKAVEALISTLENSPSIE
jgi:uncharacterized protein with HEPN domain